MQRVGVIGTLVWDRIWPHARAGLEPHEGWGGIAYSLAAMAAAVPAGWEIVPIVKVGSDLAGEADSLLRSIPGLHLGDGVREVGEANNRVVLRYHDPVRRCEQLTGGVPPWRWEELAPIVGGLDALYVNFISGFEIELTEMERLRAGFHKPIYCDLHSLLLGRDADGRRSPQPLREWRRWIGCCDAVQLNEDEIRTLDPALPDAAGAAYEILGCGPSLLLVTLGAEGAAYGGAWMADSSAPTGLVCVPPEPGAVDGDPTGCGDVWGATAFAALLAGRGVRESVRRANAAAARKIVHAGVDGLFQRLRGGARSA
jgi:hypothetical protein